MYTASSIHHWKFFLKITQMKSKSKVMNIYRSDSSLISMRIYMTSTLQWKDRQQDLWAVTEVLPIPQWHWWSKRNPISELYETLKLKIVKITKCTPDYSVQCTQQYFVKICLLERLQIWYLAQPVGDRGSYHCSKV